MESNPHTSIYTASFTTGSLLYRETTAMLPLLESEQSQSLLEKEVKENLFIQINSEKSRRNVINEIVKRFAVVDTNFWSFYKTRDEKEQKIMLFYICLKYYKLMFDFHFNVTVRRWLSSSQNIEPFLYRIELSEISGRNPEVDAWTDSTKEKIISVYLRILKDIEILNGRGMHLKPFNLSDEAARFFASRQEFWFFDACLLSPSTKKLYINM